MGPTNPFYSSSFFKSLFIVIVTRETTPLGDQSHCVKCLIAYYSVDFANGSAVKLPYSSANSGIDYIYSNLHDGKANVPSKRIERTKTTSMEDVSAGVLKKKKILKK